MIPKRNEVQLGYSRDGFHFSRPTHESFMGVNEKPGAWNYGNMQSINGVPLIVDDSLYIYSSGRSLNGKWWDAGVSTGLATLRRDGFVSMKAEKDGFLVTEPLQFDGTYLFVNIDTHLRKSSLAVELIDTNCNVIEGYSKKDCNLIRGIDKTKQMVTWKKYQDLSPLLEKNIRIKFYLTNGELYSFWISPWETGESRGFTAGGGPNLHKSGLDIPLH